MCIHIYIDIYLYKWIYQQLAPPACLQVACFGLHEGYIGVDRKENGNYYLGFRVKGLGLRVEGS